MAQATTIPFGAIKILIGDGASPENFVAPCGLTSLTDTTNVETNTTNIPDCEDPDMASWLAIDEVSRQKVVSGSGILSREAFKRWQDWDLAGGFKNAKVVYDLSAANGGGELSGRVLLTTFEKTAEAKGRWQISVGITFDGKPEWDPASA